MTTRIIPDIQARIQALDLMDPTDHPKQRPRKAAPPLESLEGKRAGFLDNKKGNADVMLQRVREMLVEQHRIGSSVVKSKWVFSAPASDEVLRELESCDFVVTAIGD